MTWAAVGSLGTHQSATLNQASSVLTTTATLEVGNVAILAIAVDNHQTTDGDEGAVSGVVDSAGNTWVKAAEFTNGNGVAQGGATCSIWYTKATTQLTSGGTITASFTNSASRDASAMSAHEFTVTAGAVISVEASATLANDGADPGSLNATTPNAEFLRFRAIATESKVTVVLTPTAGWTAITAMGVSVGATTVCMWVSGEFIISTATSAASDPAAYVSTHSSVYVAFKEAPGVILGVVTKTEAGNTVVATGVLPLKGVVTRTEAANTLAATARIAIVGTTSVTEAPDTLVAAGEQITEVIGDAALIEAPNTLAASGVLPIVGAASAVEAGDTLSAQGALPIIGAVVITEGVDTLSAVGYFRNLATLSVTEAPNTLIAAGALGLTGVVSVIEVLDTIEAFGVSDVKGVLSVTERPDTIVFTSSKFPFAAPTPKGFATGKLRAPYGWRVRRGRRERPDPYSW